MTWRLSKDHPGIERRKDTGHDRRRQGGTALEVEDEPEDHRDEVELEVGLDRLVPTSEGSKLTDTPACTRSGGMASSDCTCRRQTGRLALAAMC